MATASVILHLTELLATYVQRLFHHERCKDKLPEPVPPLVIATQLVIDCRQAAECLATAYKTRGKCFLHHSCQ